MARALRRPRQILLIGATGRIGRRVSNLLVEQGARIRALVRDESRARTVLPPALEFVTGDLGKTDTLPGALESVDAILLVTPVSPQQAQLEGNLVRAAAAVASAALIVKVSGVATYADSYVDSGRQHAQTEALVRASGLPFVFLHPLFFMQNLAFQFDEVRRSGVVRAAVGDARIAMIDAADIAGVATRLLTGVVDRTGDTLSLTGPRALQYADVAAELEVRLGRRVVYEPQTIAALRAQLTRNGQAAWHVELVSQFNRAFAEGIAENVSNDAAEVLERPPRPLGEFLDEALATEGRPSGRNPFPS